MNASPHNLSRQQVMALLEERDTLLEQVRQLEEALAPAAILPRSWRLTSTEERLLCALRAVGPNVLHHERAMLALYGMLDEAPQQKILDVLVCKIRRKLMEAQAQIRIETIWGRGWRLSPESCARFDALVGEDRVRWAAQGRAVA
ncbi:helix-turn-helix domain-containing protein [Methylobacterium mesophilicum SR1.6/6]|uniref:Helix-turn-helix domain-containing protein n=1 Tax=Methylobacterium mesophilicum SR1.6/6 TaxID=908290 RepID=A0A6B9FT02_9HYPH|nr:helix-turn-helix domain-containing protein [Methylobacterium mesophilicum]QGY05557.1 helix-turn-helix domain-containing protein [Methylobacterium mesophilicum SR1.6/6]